MIGYIVLSALLLFALIECLALAARLKKERKASQFVNSAFRKNHEISLAATGSLVKLQAVTQLPDGVPEKFAEEQIAHKLAACLPEFWHFKRNPDNDEEYRATVYIYKMDGWVE